MLVNRHRRRRPFTRANIVVASALRGCNCKPALKRRHIDGNAHVNVFHDEHCPATDSGSQLLLRRNSHQTSEDFARAVIEILEALEGEETA